MKISLTENEYRALNKALAAEIEYASLKDTAGYSYGEHEGVICEVSHYKGMGIAFDCYLK